MQVRKPVTAQRNFLRCTALVNSPVIMHSSGAASEGRSRAIAQPLSSGSRTAGMALSSGLVCWVHAGCSRDAIAAPSPLVSSF